MYRKSRVCSCSCSPSWRDDVRHEFRRFSPIILPTFSKSDPYNPSSGAFVGAMLPDHLEQQLIAAHPISSWIRPVWQRGILLLALALSWRFYSRRLYSGMSLIRFNRMASSQSTSGYNIPSNWSHFMVLIYIPRSTMESFGSKISKHSTEKEVW